jgi:hypothetical protein
VTSILAGGSDDDGDRLQGQRIREHRQEEQFQMRQVSALLDTQTHSQPSQRRREPFIAPRPTVFSRSGHHSFDRKAIPVGAAQTPFGQRLAAAVGACQNCPVEGVGRTAPETGVARP